MIIDISSDEESTPLQQSTPIKFYPLNVIQALNLSGESTVAKMGSETSMEMTASTFESGPSPYKKITFSTSPVSDGEEFRVEGQNINTTDESYFEEPDTPPSIASTTACSSLTGYNQRRTFAQRAAYKN